MLSGFSSHTHNVLALVRLAGIAFYSDCHTILAANAVLVSPLLAEAIPPLAVELARGLVLSPGSLKRVSQRMPSKEYQASYLLRLHHLSHNFTGFILLRGEGGRSGQWQKSSGNGGELHLDDHETGMCLCWRCRPDGKCLLPLYIFPHPYDNKQPRTRMLAVATPCS